MKNTTIDIYDDTYAGLVFLARRVLRADGTVRWAGRDWYVVIRDGEYQLGSPVD